MKFSILVAAVMALLPSTMSTDAFTPKAFLPRTASRTGKLQSTATITEVMTKAIEGMKPGTSGLRKKVEVWQSDHYVENFIQSLLDTAKANNNGEMLHT